MLKRVPKTVQLTFCRAKCLVIEHNIKSVMGITHRLQSQECVIKKGTKDICNTPSAEPRGSLSQQASNGVWESALIHQL